MKATTRVTSVISIETLATLHRYYLKKDGVHLGNLSRLVAESLDFLCHLIVNTEDDLEAFTSPQEAWDYLVEQRLSTKTMLTKGRRSLMRALQDEALADANASDYVNRRIGRKPAVPQPVNTDADAIFDSIASEMSDMDKIGIKDSKEAIAIAQALQGHPTKKGDKNGETNDE